MNTEQGSGEAAPVAKQHRARAEEWIKDAEKRIEEYAPRGSVDMTAAIASLALAHAILATSPEQKIPASNIEIGSIQSEEVVEIQHCPEKNSEGRQCIWAFPHNGMPHRWATA